MFISLSDSLSCFLRLCLCGWVLLVEADHVRLECSLKRFIFIKEKQEKRSSQHHLYEEVVTLIAIILLHVLGFLNDLVEPCWIEQFPKIERLLD